VAHIDKHLAKISPKDKESIKILQTMREDEDIHAQQAGESGGEELKMPIKKIMSVTAKVMTSTSAYI
jgi:ubiquinone biosynthesis monooxygenase Coq7